ncbi:MAG: EscU/YscU/HrcU family type III secretion system export apparatus switch protein [Armatimonadetes bacterium]|nr:EscU/YscU/HrcU family type III secretion system export apparatus switch protein [Armatimonadota bacterium]
MAEKPSQERTEPPTPRKRRKARRQGTVARSTDLTSSLVIFAIAIFAPLLASGLAIGLLEMMHTGLRVQDPSSGVGDVLGHVWATAAPAIIGLVPIALIGIVVGVSVGFAQVGFVPTLEPMNPKFERINPIQGFKRLISRRALFEFGKTIAKLLLIGYIAWHEVTGNWDAMLNLSMLTLYEAVSWVGRLIASIFLKVAVAWIALGALDYWFQRRQVEKELMMTKDELKRDMRETETSPELRAEMHRRRRRLARQRMMSNVKHADVVITNPLEYAVALKYESKRTAAPVVLAKGRHLVAERIRKEARRHRVPLVPNPPLARSLFEQVEIGEAIPTTLFQAVAEILAFVFKQKGRRV